MTVEIPRDWILLPYLNDSDIRDFTLPFKFILSTLLSALTNPRFDNAH